MIEIKPANTRKALVVGLGRTGLSCARFLAAKGMDVTVTDSRDLPPMYQSLRQYLPSVPVYTGGFNPAHFTAADLVVVSPGVPLSDPAVRVARDSGAEVVGDVELFLREIDAPVVAVTGSNGKSTVTAMVGAMCREHGLDVAVAGNIGNPVLDVLRERAVSPEVFVLELSSFQLETVQNLRARAAAILNLSEDHLDRYPDFEAYVRAKRRIFDGCGTAVVNRDDVRVMQAPPPGCRCVSFGAGAPAGDGDYGLRTHDEQVWLVRGPRRVLRSGEVPLAGRHNALNVLAAMALAEQLGVGMRACIEAIRKFQGLPHRMEVVVEREGVRWINDSKATNVGAATAAIQGLASPVVLIAGGEGKGADFAPLREPLLRFGRAVVLLGRDAAQIERAIAGAVPVLRAKDMRDAVLLAASRAVAGDTVLLAPACASFDMYRDFEQRGEHFTSLVWELS